eukprot:TRINITY_DN1102_c0_g1_i1.p1 TRINITY_DN1102_c0_g1~~TRINITY_DN1102_c0_g1_i1.p1  ORF type:complete len:370 (+),score=147.36 TRINITY_DN1102_c0_g1_i1:135-1244(+)
MCIRDRYMGNRQRTKKILQREIYIKMVRLEKVLYERLVNTKTFGRARQIATPAKYYNENRAESLYVGSFYLLATGLTGRIYRFIEPVISKLGYQWARDVAISRGLALEDFLLFQDRELRRCVFFENAIRQSAHPYMHILFKRRRARYYKVERGLRGFVVPDWVQREAESRLLVDTAENKDIWETFMYENFMSDITPTSRWTGTSKFIVIDLFSLYGLMNPQAWDRYFFNEAFSDGYTREDKARAANPFPNINLNTEEGKREFEREVNRFIKLYPGAIVKEGEQFDFQRFYVQWAITNGKDVSRYDQGLVSELRQKLEEKRVARLGWKVEKGKKTNLVGTLVPKFLRPAPGRILSKNAQARELFGKKDDR